MSRSVDAPPIVLLQYGTHTAFAPLPTFDPHCLVAQTYMKLAKVPFVENNCNNPNASPINKLPTLSINEVKTVVYTEIISELRLMGYDLDEDFAEREKMEIEAWTSLVQNRLVNSQLYNMWAERSNYDEVTSMVYTRTMPFPLSLLLPARHKRNVMYQLTSAGFADERLAYEEAARCYKAISHKLGTNRYMMGDEPCSLDAVVFGFLATQFIPNLPQRKLHYLISQHANLVDYINRILNKCFAPGASVKVDVEPAQRWLKSVEDEKVDRSDAVATKADSSSAWAIAFGIGATVLFLSTQNLQFLVLYNRLSARFASKSAPRAPTRKFTREQEEERSKWFSGMGNTLEESAEDRLEPARGAILDASHQDPESNPMREVNRFSPEEKDVVYIRDDGKTYDWDEKYLEEMETGSDLPEDYEDLGDDDEEDFD